jgi:hypothetical protein
MIHRKYADRQAQTEAKQNWARPVAWVESVNKPDIGIIDGPVQILVEALGF